MCLKTLTLSMKMLPKTAFDCNALHCNKTYISKKETNSIQLRSESKQAFMIFVQSLKMIKRFIDHKHLGYNSSYTHMHTDL